MTDSKLFRAHCYFLDNGGERCHPIQFLDRDLEAATLSAWRWVRNRQKALPECFGTILCIKIYGVTPQRVDEKTGYLPTDHGFGGYEWKCDWGVPPLLPANV